MGYITPLLKKEFYSSSKSCKELEFNGFYPHKSVYEFIHALEDGLFVLSGKIVGLFKVNQWFYPVCHCGSFLNIGAGSYYCGDCHLSVFSATSMSKLQIAIQDSTSSALLPMSDTLLQGIDSINNNVFFKLTGVSFALSADGEKMLTDKVVLIIVKKVMRADDLFDHVVQVLRITDDVDLIKQFHLEGSNFTPSKCVFQGSSVGLTPIIGNDGLFSSLPHCVGTGKKPMIADGLHNSMNVATPISQKKSIDAMVPNDAVMFMGGMSSEGST
ncbi:hypothetical protein TSUD_63660 [Trifolium subterraneum]|uniref:Replication factor A C-terminal domain-containing protein n=1 Tax=Trifolium subterraneum TaxID=3900 RepID=A0A2Z6NNX6_TRISU|nr:hypothetical protein TSUD_63660 [Trifolium subterraneum]